MNEQEFQKEYLNEFPKPEFTPPLYIVAGSYRQALDLARSKNISPVQWHYVGILEDILTAEGSICFYGTCYMRADIAEIEQFVTEHPHKLQIVALKL